MVINQKFSLRKASPQETKNSSANDSALYSHHHCQDHEPRWRDGEGVRKGQALRTRLEYQRHYSRTDMSSITLKLLYKYWATRYSTGKVSLLSRLVFVHWRGLVAAKGSHVPLEFCQSLIFEFRRGRFIENHRYRIF